MQIAIRATEQKVVVDGVECRLWDGITFNGVPCHVLVHRIAVDKSLDASEFQVLEPKDVQEYSLAEVERLRARVAELEAQAIEVN
jgi:hypothetical protein